MTKIKYSEIKKLIKKAANKIKGKKRIRTGKIKIFGYNKRVEEAIKIRRAACQTWKKEKDEIRKTEKKNEQS